MEVIGAKLGTLKLKYTIAILCQTGFSLNTWKIITSHDAIVLFILPERSTMSLM